MKALKISHIRFMCAVALLSLTAIASATPPVTMKVLVLAGSSSEASYQSITTYLAEIGVPYQAVVLSSITPDSSGNRLSKVALSNSTTGSGLYQGVILTNSTFTQCSPSCMSTTDWTTLNTYASQFGVRVVSYYTSPAAQWGLLPANSGATYTAASPLNVTLTTAGSAVFPYLNAANPIPVAGQGTTGIEAYLATPTAAANETTTPLLMAGTYTVAVTHTTAAGEQILALTMDNAPTLLHSEAFGYGVINWVTQGIFLGSRKVYLNPEIDDLMLGNWIYAPALHPACESAGTCPTYIITTGEDLQQLANWQATLQTDPQFQAFRLTFAYNGIGSTWFAPGDPLFTALKSNSSNFWWLSHSWDHPNLDCYSVNSNGSCVAATLAQSQAELNQNIAVAPSLGITLDQVGMVTPCDSGQDDLSFLQAAGQVGLKYMAFPEYPPSPNTGMINSLYPSIMQIPRIYTNMYWDVDSPDSGVYGSWPDEYNAEYGPDGTTPTYSENQTYSQIIQNESQSVLQTNLLTYAPYLLGFHMDNANQYSGTNSVFTDLMSATISKYESLFTLPVVTLNMEQVGSLLSEWMSYDASGVVGVYTPGVSVVLTTTKAATIPVTGMCSQSSCGTYGGQIQDNVVMAANSTVTIPLTSNTGVSLTAVSLNPTSVTGSSSTTGTVTLSGAAPTGGVAVSLSSNNAAASVPASVTVAAGSSAANFSVSTTAVTSSVSATISATYGGATQTTGLTITPAPSLASVSVNPTSVNGGTSATGTVTLSIAAPAGGISVSLSSNNSAASVPASVTVAAGSTTATFTVSTTTVTSSVTATLTASYNGTTKTTGLTITPATATVLSSVSVNPTSVASGTSSTGTVTLSAAAPTGGVTVSLSSSNSGVASVPASVTVASGSNTASFTVTTYSVAATTSVTITASYNSASQTAALTVTPLATLSLSSVSVSPTSVTSEVSATGTVTLSAAAPAGGIVVALWTTGTIAFVPDSVTVAAGSKTATFTVTTNYTSTTQQDTITAFYDGASQTANITVTP